MFAAYGLAVGVLFGFFGMGGFLVTPALLVFGYPTPVAVGSGMAFVFGTSLVAALRHRGYGQVDRRLGVTLFVGSALGIELGRRLMVALDTAGLATTVVSVAYVVLLIGVGVFVLRDAHRDGSGSDESSLGTRLVGRLRAISIPPRTSVPNGGPTVSLWVAFALALVVGVLAGLLGVGGGFLLVPALLYGLGLSAPIAVGTNVFQMAVSAGYGTFVYAGAGNVDLGVVVSLLVGSALGARVGSLATNYVDEADIKDAFAAVLLAGGAAVASKHLGDLFGIPALRMASPVLIFGSAVVVSAVVVVRLLAALGFSWAPERLAKD